jgi:tetratricopeptide (TPR) repeat protein
MEKNNLAPASAFVIVLTVMFKIFPRTPVHLLLVALLGLLVYSNAFNVPFQFDDYYYIEYNPAVKDFDYFTEPSRIERLLEKKGLNTYIHFKNRTMGYLTFFLNYRIHGSRVSGYHIANLGLHLLNACLVYLTVILILKTQKLKNSMDEHRALNIPFLSAVIFVSHPIQTQAVTYISQRFALLVTFFCLISLAGYLASRLSDSKHRRYVFYAVSLLSAVFAMKTKENAFTLPFMLLLSELMFFRSSAKSRVPLLLPFFLASLIIPLSVIEFDRPLGEALDDAARTQTDISRSDYLITQFRVIVTYIRLLIFPINQNLDYGYPLFDSFWDSRVILSCIFLLFVLGLCAYLIRFTDNKRRELKVISYGILWFFVTLSVESGPVPLADIISEHRLYLPSIGIITSSTATMVLIMNGRGTGRNAKTGFVLLMVFFCIALSALTYARNRVWQEPLALWKDVTVKSPDKARGFYNLGVAYKNRGLIDEAIKYHKMALMREPTHFEAINSLGILYAAKGFTGKAEECYRLALKIRPDFPDAHFNLGLVYLDEGLLDQALVELDLTLNIDPSHRKARGFLDYISGMKKSEKQDIGRTASE